MIPIIIGWGNFARMITSELIQTGFVLGIFHVLAGPDHLSALATLSVGNSWKAMTLGIRWGLGHSTGLVVVAIIFISLKGDLDLSRVGRLCNIMLGFFMIAIGFYGVIGALRTYDQKRMKRDLDICPPSSPLSASTNGNNKLKRNNSESLHILATDSLSEGEEEQGGLHTSGNIYHKEDEDLATMWLSHFDMNDATTQKIVSFAIGVLHGVAGPGAILGVLPAIEMQSWRASSCYLGSFVVASTISMGAFAALYGELTKRMGSSAESIELGLRVFSASLSVIVGFVWLALSFLDKLSDFFH